MYSIQGQQMHELGNITFNVYPASKRAITAITKTLQRELDGEKIRVTVCHKHIKVHIIYNSLDFINVSL